MGIGNQKPITEILLQIGYARVSTGEQCFDMQVDALRAAGCERIYTEAVSGARTERPVLNELLRNVRAGDVLVIWKLDRLGRSLKHLVELAGMLMNQDVGLRSLHDPVDTTSPQGRLSTSSARRFVRGLLPPERSHELQAQIVKAGVPL
jgi:DNA invertase Pin-like site-specific DNA recombinase